METRPVDANPQENIRDTTCLRSRPMARGGKVSDRHKKRCFYDPFSWRQKTVNPFLPGVCLTIGLNNERSSSCRYRRLINVINPAIRPQPVKFFIYYLLLTLILSSHALIRSQKHKCIFLSSRIVCVKSRLSFCTSSALPLPAEKYKLEAASNAVFFS
jgi:hypothetical protein